MTRAGALLCLAALSGCLPTPSSERAPRGTVSVDYCADLALVSLLPPRRIAALSYEVQDSELPPAYRHIPRVRPRVEAIVALRPTQVVRSYGGGPRFADQLTRAGVDVVALDSPSNLEAVDREIARTARALDAEGRGTALRNNLAAALAAPGPTQARRALYLTPGAVTTGPDGLIGDLLARAKLHSVEQRAGWHSLSPERLRRDPPDLVVRAFWDRRHRQDRWSPALRPALQQTLAVVPAVDVDARSVACGTAHVVDALRRLKAAP